MKILEITFIPPDLMSGGGRGIYQSIVSLLGCADVDYIGPKFEKSIFKEQNQVNIIENLYADSKFTVKKLFRLLFRGISTDYYNSWRDYLDKIEWDKYDYVHFESSRYFFAVKLAKQKGKKIFIRMHNIEKDYGEKLFQHNKNIFSYLRKTIFSYNERKTVNIADKCIFLTKTDINRAKDLYDISEDKILLNPVCVSSTEIFHHCTEGNFTILLTGTLDFGPNVEGILWFIEEVYLSSDLSKNAKVIIAGARPNCRIKEIIKGASNISLIDTPLDMSPYYNSADIYLAPIFYGAGMKVKVAEALAFGLTVVGTGHAFIGYEEINCGKIVFRDAIECKKILWELIHHKIKCYDKKVVVSQFMKHYSLDSSIHRYRQFFDSR